MKTITKILYKIGISEENDCFYTFKSSKWSEIVPIRLHKGLKEINPHSFLLHENKIIALFFEITPNNATDTKSLFRKIWNLGGSPAVFIITEQNVDIYNGFSFDTKTSLFEKLKIGNVDLSIENIDSDFSIWDIITGKTFQSLNTTKIKPQVDEKLLGNLESTKNVLEKNGLDNTLAQNIIGRLLFSRYLLDRDVKIKSKYFKDKQSFLELIQNKELLYEYFGYLKKTFNGDLFPVTELEISQVSKTHLNYLYELFSGSDIKDNAIQRSLFDLYDFNIIPIELISEVYERFIGKSKQKKNAAFYTPAFLVDYILEKTVKPHLETNKHCKVFDPSCGSGIFLVESLRTIIEKNLDHNGFIQIEDLKKLLVDNIYGVDIDENAINLTVFSLCLTILDYIEPKDITKFKFDNLIGKNLFVADFFDTDHLFNEKINNLDFILGNPPWGSDKEKNSLHIEYFHNHNIPISDKQIAQTFVARTKDFSEKNTKCALVLPSKPILYNHKANEFRQYFLTNFYVREILELSPVRNQIFSGAVAPTAVVFFDDSYDKTTEDNIVLHTSVKPNIFLQYLKLIVIEKSDIKQIKQSYFIKYDYLWKIMLYGNVLDFYLIKRLKEEYDSLNQVIEESKLNFGQGFIVGGEKVDKYDASFLIGKKYLDTKKKNLSKFSINKTSCKKWEIEKLHRPRTQEVFQPPYVLLKKGFSKQNFSLVSAYTENEYVFTHSVTAIRGENKLYLKNICGVLNSIFSSYYLLVQGNSAGIEREQSDDRGDRFNIPVVIDDSISKKVDLIQKLHLKQNSDLMHNSGLEAQIKSEEEKLNDTILDSFEFTDIEKSLIDYATQVTIPQINNDKEPIAKTTEIQLKSFAKIFSTHFSERWNGNPNYFAIDIYYNSYIVAMNFKVTDSKPKQIIQFHPNKKADDLFMLMKLGEERVSDTFYKQRDIRGFNESSFYLVKPNQYKNWHSAIAHSDLSEFIEAMLKAEKESK